MTKRKSKKNMKQFWRSMAEDFIKKNYPELNPKHFKLVSVRLKNIWIDPVNNAI